MGDDLEYERVLLVKPDIFIFRIPPRTSNRGFRASDWKLDAPDWTGRLRLISKGKLCFIKLEEKTSGQLFAQCPVDQYPGIAIEPVSDSSRYFVLRIVSDTGNTAFIGIGFADRGDSFDLNVALQDHFKVIEKEKEIESEKDSEKEPVKLDLKFKEGETIKVNLNIAKPASSRKIKSPASGGGNTGAGFLPPPPGSSTVKLPACPTKSVCDTKKQEEEVSTTSSDTALSDAAFMAEFDKLSVNQATAAAASTTVSSGNNWDDGTSVSSHSNPTEDIQSSSNTGWAQF